MYYLLLENLITPFVMIFVGHTFKKHPGCGMDPNHVYNTPTSRKTQEHWVYAQSIAPDIFISLGKILGVIEIAIIALMYLFHAPIHAALGVGGFAGLCFLLLGFYKTDSEIEKKFM